MDRMDIILKVLWWPVLDRKSGQFVGRKESHFCWWTKTDFEMGWQMRPFYVIDKNDRLIFSFWLASTHSLYKIDIFYLLHCKIKSTWFEPEKIEALYLQRSSFCRVSNIGEPPARRQSKSKLEVFWSAPESDGRCCWRARVWAWR